VLGSSKIGAISGYYIPFPNFLKNLPKTLLTRWGREIYHKLEILEELNHYMKYTIGGFLESLAVEGVALNGNLGRRQKEGAILVTTCRRL